MGAKGGSMTIKYAAPRNFIYSSSVPYLLYAFTDEAEV